LFRSSGIDIINDRFFRFYQFSFFITIKIFSSWFEALTYNIISLFYFLLSIRKYFIILGIKSYTWIGITSLHLLFRK